MAVPKSISAPMAGMWWSDIDGRWIETNLDTEAEHVMSWPPDDIDLLGEAATEGEPSKVFGNDTVDFQGVEVKESFYYKTLDVKHNAEPAQIKRQYYLLARKCHPDKTGSHDTQAADKFKDIAEAYQVLSDPELRKRYDLQGREGLTADKTSLSDEDGPDPALLFAFLFGSDRFQDYIGRLSVASSALAGDNNLSIQDARHLQIRRCTRLALKLALKLENWDDKENEDGKNQTLSLWEREAKELSSASFGYQLIALIGQVYSLSATQFLGSMDSGIGMPSISKWAANRNASRKLNSDASKKKFNTLLATMGMMTDQKELEAAMTKASTDEEKSQIKHEFLALQQRMSLQIMWTMTAVDITATIHEACQMVFFDKSVDKKVQKRRAKGLRKLGEIFMACPKPSGPDLDAGNIFEDAAFAAMLETVKRKEEDSFRASYRS